MTKRRTDDLTWDAWVAEVETAAEAEGPVAVAEFNSLGLHFAIARKIAARRRELGLTQAQLQESSGVDRAEISRIERGLANPTLTTLGALSASLKFEVELVELEDDGNGQAALAGKPKRAQPALAG